MSLRVWLPLNRDLRNQGLLNVTVTNYSATFSDSCYSFNASDQQYIQYTGFDATSLPELTIMCWAKPTNTNLDGVFDISRDNSFQFGIANNNCLIVRDNSTGLTGQYKAYSIGDVESGKWIHICCMYNKGTVEIYKNGVLYSTNNVGGTHLNDRNGLDWLNNYWIGKAGLSSQYFSGSIFDFRIYDHALSKKEVVELARGCVLHYPCNDINSQVMNNVFTFPTFDTPDSSGGWSHWGTTGVVATYSQNTNKEYIYNKSNTYSHKVSCDSTSPYNYWTYKGPTYINETGYRSVQAIIKMEDGSVPDVNKVHWSWNGNTGTRPSNQYIPLGNGFYLIKCEGLQQSNRASGNNNLIGLYTHPGNTVYISEAYCENDVQVCSNIWHTGSYYLKDVSGFDNHSLITGSLPLVTTPKTPRYDKCLNIDNSGTNKNYANCTIAVPQVKSASFWVYCEDAYPVSKIVFVDLDSGLGFGWGGSSNLITSTKSASPYLLSQYSPDALIKNSWNHIVINIIQLESKTQLFINDIEQTPMTNATAWLNQTPGFYLGMRNRSGSENYFTGKISDFRLFSRVLTQTDVDDLYKDSFAIDKSQNGYCYELNESDAQSSVDVKKNGLLACKNYSEVFDALYLPAGTYVDTLLNFVAGDICKAETFIKYDEGGSGRDLMGFSGRIYGYWGVKADNTWESHGTFSYIDADITKYNRINWNYTCSNNDPGGNYKIGCLGSGSSVRNKTIYHVRLWKNNVLERDLYPCSISNQVGLIDGLTGTFYPVQKLNLTATDASLVSGAPKARLGKSGVTMNEIHEI